MILNAAEDFKKNTLRALPTVLEKLAYICSLQTSHGYSHWGLTRIFGEQRAQRAISAIHGELATELVRTPIRELCREYEDASLRPVSSEFLNEESFTLRAPANGDELLSAHLQLIQQSIVSVAGREHTTPPTA